MWSRENLFDSDVLAASATHRVPVALIKAVIGVESSFKADAINKSDPGWAWGLMQMIPRTAQGLGYTGPMDRLLTDTRLAVMLGAKLLQENLSRSGSTVEDSVSAYNGGWRPSSGYGGKRADGTYANQVYVNRIMSAYRYFGGEGVGGGEPSPFPAPGTARGAPVEPPPAPVAPVVKRTWWKRFLFWIWG